MTGIFPLTTTNLIPGRALKRSGLIIRKESITLLKIQWLARKTNPNKWRRAWKLWTQKRSTVQKSRKKQNPNKKKWKTQYRIKLYILKRKLRSPFPKNISKVKNHNRWNLIRIKVKKIKHQVTDFCKIKIININLTLIFMKFQWMWKSNWISFTKKSKVYKN